MIVWREIVEVPKKSVPKQPDEQPKPKDEPEKPKKILSFYVTRKYFKILYVSL
jgi:hypothetical protein